MTAKSTPKAGEWTFEWVDFTPLSAEQREGFAAAMQRVSERLGYEVRRHNPKGKKHRKGRP